MKVECTREKLAGMIQKSERIAGKNLTLPVLSCVLLEAKKNSLTIKTTNLDLGIEMTLPVKIETEGVVAVPAAIFSNLLSHLSRDKNVTLEVVGEHLKVSTASNTTIIKSLPNEDFPSIPVIEDGKSFKIYAQDFVRGLKSVWYSSAVSSMKPELSSVYVHSEENTVVFVATDSFRLAEKRISLKKAPEISQILIPFKNIPEIMRILEEVTEEVTVTMNKNQISFAANGIYLTSRIVDGVFPDYKQIIPKEHKTEAIVLKADLLASLKLANIFSDSFNQILIKVVPKEKLFELKSKNSDVGENVNKIEGALSGDELTIHFNYKYIVDCFQSLEADSISLEFGVLNRPMVIRGVSDRSFLYLVMPMNK